MDRIYVAIGIAIACVALGFFGAWQIQGLRLDTANAKVQAAVTKQIGAEHDLAQCKQASQKQNQAIEAMRARAEQAERDLAVAREDREKKDSTAETVLDEKTPEGVDECLAARDAFDAELRKERGR